jgi:hypothetical protein
VGFGRCDEHEYFVLDNRQTSNRLTLNLGLCHTLNFPSTEADDHGAAFDLVEAGELFVGVGTAAWWHNRAVL